MSEEEFDTEKLSEMMHYWMAGCQSAYALRGDCVNCKRQKRCTLIEQHIYDLIVESKDWIREAFKK